MTSPLRPILWDIYEEHLEEAAFLRGQWERALVAAHTTVDDVIQGPEERLLAHLDGLVLGGRRVADRLLAPSLADNDDGKVFASAWVLVQAEDADHLGVVLEALRSAKGAPRAAMARALELSPRADLAKPLAELWEAGDEALRGALFDAMASSDPTWTNEHLPAALAAGDPVLRQAALRALRHVSPDARARHASDVEDALRSEHGGVREEAIATGYALGARGVMEACRRGAEAVDSTCRVPLALMALGDDGSDRAWLTARLAVPEARRHVLWALGFAGDMPAAEALVAAMSDATVARIAGEAFSAITGASITGPLVKPGAPQGPGDDDLEPDAPPPDAVAEDLLLVPAAGPVTTWWTKARRRMHPGARYVYGEARPPGGSFIVPRRATMWRRPVFALAIAAATSASVMDTRGWVRTQAS